MEFISQVRSVFVGSVCVLQYHANFFHESLVGFGFAAVAPPEIFRKISQNLSPAGVTSPFVERAMRADATSVVLF